MAYRQKHTPNVNAFGRRGWCLEYVDNAINATKRTATAKIAYTTEKSAKRIKAETPPVNVWVVGFLSFTKGIYTPYGHVFLMKYKGNGKYEIRDSEIRAGARAVYANINQLMAWFGNYAPSYLGWSTHCDGRQIAEQYTPPSTPTRKTKKGTAKVTVDALNVRNGSSTLSKAVATYKKGETFNYDSYIDVNGYRWLSYISWSGQRRYVAQRTSNSRTKYVSGGV